ncbi:MAG: MFS transporter [Patescibacteria group bacterium]
MTKLFTSISECRRSPQGECTFHKKTTINRIILLLIGIELFFVFIFAFSGPFVSVFIVKGITGATVSIVGIAAMIFLVTKSTLQIPFSRLVDKAASENKVIGVYSIGQIIIALCPLILAFSTNQWHIFLAQFSCGFGNALTYPSYNALFTQHIDKEQTAFEWSFYDTIIGFAGAGAAALGGVMIDKFGFKIVFLITAVIILLGSFLPLFFYRRYGNNHQHI